MHVPERGEAVRMGQEDELHPFMQYGQKPDV